jgi:predicted nucleic acid-binding protein
VRIDADSAARPWRPEGIFGSLPAAAPGEVVQLMRPSPSPQVWDWVSAQAPGELFTTAVTVAEIRYDLERLPDGRRKDSLLATATEVFAAFSEFIQPFDADAAVMRL